MSSVSISGVLIYLAGGREELLAAFAQGSGFGTGFPLQVVEDQIKALISGSHSRRLWPLLVMRQNNGLGFVQLKRWEKRRPGSRHMGLSVRNAGPLNSSEQILCAAQLGSLYSLWRPCAK